MTSFYQKKLIEVAFPLEKISNVFFRTNREAAGRRGRDIHVWWAQQPHSVVRAILFLQLVDDPATLSQLNLTIEEQRELRRRYYEIVDKLIDEEVSEGLLLEARKEILLSWGGQYAPTREAFLNSKEQIFNYIESGKIPPIPPLHDPFAGSGTIPLEAQRLGLRSRASDINPIATLLNKTILVLPSLVCGLPFGDSQSDQVQPRELTQASTKSASYGFPSNSGAKSLLFEALTRYGKKVFGEGNELLSHYYPQAKLLITREGYIRHATHEEVLKDSQLPVPERRIFELPILAWIWVRTVRSPHPLFRHVEVPLATSFVLSSRTGEETWVEVQPHQSAKSSRVGPRAYDFVLKNSKLHGLPKSPISRGTFLGEESGFECGMSGIPIPLSYIKSEGLAGRIGLRLMAILAWKDGEIVFLPPSPEQEAVARSAKPRWRPVQNLPDNPHIFPQSDYGLSTFADLFTSRQLLALTTFSDLLTKLPERIVADVGLQFGGEEQKGRRDDELHDLKDGSPPLPSPQKVAEAVTTFLALCL
ncbi:MAG: DUF1156 domain-containing protein, partial [Chthoniobacterales bacterium]|nr:DUF1156 domain-containing protein [Chthoniobacterales bacterium]